MKRPWSKKLLGILSDYDWHDFETVISECYDEIGDDEAFEVGEYYRTYKYVRSGRLVPVAKDRDATVLSGKRILIKRSITKLKNRQIVEIETEPQGRKGRRNKPVRMRIHPNAH